MFTFYLLWFSNVSESSKDNFVVTAVSSQHCDLCILFLLISFLAKIKLGSLKAKWTWISNKTRCWIVLKPGRERIRVRLFQCSSSTETRCLIVLNPAQATKKETTCSSTGLMRRRWVALTHWAAAGCQAMSKLLAQTGCQAAVLGFQSLPSHSLIVHQHNPPGRANAARLAIVSMWTVRFCPGKCSGNLFGFLPWYHKFNYDPQHTEIKDFFVVQVEVSIMLGCVYDVWCSMLSKVLLFAPGSI